MWLVIMWFSVSLADGLCDASVTKLMSNPGYIDILSTERCTEIWESVLNRSLGAIIHGVVCSCGNRTEGGRVRDNRVMWKNPRIRLQRHQDADLSLLGSIAYMQCVRQSQAPKSLANCISPYDHLAPMKALPEEVSQKVKVEDGG